MRRGDAPGWIGTAGNRGDRNRLSAAPSVVPVSVGAIRCRIPPARTDARHAGSRKWRGGPAALRMHQVGSPPGRLPRGYHPRDRMAELAARFGDAIGCHNGGGGGGGGSGQTLGNTAGWGTLLGAVGGALLVGAAIVAAPAVLTVGAALAIGGAISMGLAAVGIGLQFDSDRKARKDQEAAAASAAAAAAAARAQSSGGGKVGCGCSKIVKHSPNVKIESEWAARVGDENDHRSGAPTIVTGAATVIVNGKPLARKGEKSSCGGVVISSASHVLIGGPSSQAPAAAATPQPAPGAPPGIFESFFNSMTGVFDRNRWGRALSGDVQATIELLNGTSAIVGVATGVGASRALGTSVLTRAGATTITAGRATAVGAVSTAAMTGAMIPTMHYASEGAGWVAEQAGASSEYVGLAKGLTGLAPGVLPHVAGMRMNKAARRPGGVEVLDPGDPRGANARDITPRAPQLEGPRRQLPGPKPAAEPEVVEPTGPRRLTDESRGPRETTPRGGNARPAPAPEPAPTTPPCTPAPRPAPKISEAISPGQLRRWAQKRLAELDAKEVLTPGELRELRGLAEKLGGSRYLQSFGDRGSFSKVTRHGDRVQKVPRAEQEFSDGTRGVLSQEERVAQYDAQKAVIDYLRAKDPELARAITEANLTSPGVMDAPYVEGATSASLKGNTPEVRAAKDAAAAERSRLNQRVSELLQAPDAPRTPGFQVRIDATQGNFLIEPTTGRLVEQGWIDPVTVKRVPGEALPPPDFVRTPSFEPQMTPEAVRDLAATGKVGAQDVQILRTVPDGQPVSVWVNDGGASPMRTMTREQVVELARDPSVQGIEVLESPALPGEVNWPYSARSAGRVADANPAQVRDWVVSTQDGNFQLRGNRDRLQQVLGDPAVKDVRPGDPSSSYDLPSFRAPGDAPPAPRQQPQLSQQQQGRPPVSDAARELQAQQLAEQRARQDAAIGDQSPALQIDGNTRIQELQRRGYDVDSLPREPYRPQVDRSIDPLNEGPWSPGGPPKSPLDNVPDWGFAPMDAPPPGAAARPATPELSLAPEWQPTRQVDRAVEPRTAPAAPEWSLEPAAPRQARTEPDFWNAKDPNEYKKTIPGPNGENYVVKGQRVTEYEVTNPDGSTRMVKAEPGELVLDGFSVIPEAAGNTVARDVGTGPLRRGLRPLMKEAQAEGYKKLTVRYMRSTHDEQGNLTSAKGRGFHTQTFDLERMFGRSEPSAPCPTCAGGGAAPSGASISRAAGSGLAAEPPRMQQPVQQQQARDMRGATRAKADLKLQENPKLKKHWLSGKIEVNGRALDFSADAEPRGKTLRVSDVSLYAWGTDGAQKGLGQAGVRDMLASVSALKDWARAQGFERIEGSWERVGENLGGTTANPGKQIFKTYDLVPRPEPAVDPITAKVLADNGLTLDSKLYRVMDPQYLDMGNMTVAGNPNSIARVGNPYAPPVPNPRYEAIEGGCRRGEITQAH
ncbi:MAG: PAAR domain-containing protein [Polyangiaceae bacterium]